MTDIEIFEMTNRMQLFGDSFVNALAEAIRLADRTNKQKLFSAFPEYVEEYGPNSQFK